MRLDRLEFLLIERILQGSPRIAFGSVAALAIGTTVAGTVTIGLRWLFVITPSGSVWDGFELANLLLTRLGWRKSFGRSGIFVMRRLLKGSADSFFIFPLDGRCKVCLLGLPCGLS